MLVTRCIQLQKMLVLESFLILDIAFLHLRLYEGEGRGAHYDF